MSLRNRKAAANIAAITHSREPEKKYPDTIKLTRAQVYSLNALANDEARLKQEIEQAQQRIKQAEGAIQATINARGEVLTEIAKGSGLVVQDLNRYQSNGEELILAKRSE